MRIQSIIEDGRKELITSYTQKKEELLDLKSKHFILNPDCQFSIVCGLLLVLIYQSNAMPTFLNNNPMTRVSPNLTGYDCNYS